MSIQQVSPSSVVANPANVNLQVKAEQPAALPQVNLAAQIAVKATKTDTVTISKQALQKLASDDDTTADEAEESTAEKAPEKSKNKK